MTGEKIFKDLAALTAWSNSRSVEIAHCHGCFDLLHPGHLAHLEAARALADCLVVTITADRYVNKGPDRPIFPAEVRARMLAALACVDAVAIVDDPSALPAIEAIRPDVYVKGPDYAEPGRDITGKIEAEREAVERHGGRIHFTDDFAYSSSNLINQHLSGRSPELKAVLREFRESGAQGRISDLMRRAHGLRALVIGDTIIDEYLFCDALGKASKEPILAVGLQGREAWAGGVIAAANHAAAICARVDVETVVTPDLRVEALIDLALRPNVFLQGHACAGATTWKTRYVERGFNRKVFEVYGADAGRLTLQSREQLDRHLAARAAEFDLTIVTDFGHGLIEPSTIAALQGSARFLAVNAQTNAGNLGFNPITRYTRADYICLDLPEARLALGRQKIGAQDAALEIAERCGCPRVVVTQGRKGCVTHSDVPVHGSVEIPAFTSDGVIDTVGAGDAFFAVTAPLAACPGSDLRDIALVGNAAAALKVAVLGHRQSTDRLALMRYVETLLK